MSGWMRLAISFTVLWFLLLMVLGGAAGFVFGIFSAFPLWAAWWVVQGFKLHRK